MSLVVATFNERCNNASALTFFLSKEYGAENLTGLNNQPISCWLRKELSYFNLGRRTFRNGRCTVFHCIDELKREC